VEKVRPEPDARSSEQLGDREASERESTPSSVLVFLMPCGIQQRVAVVTGASQGIGRAIALQLACEGACVGVTYRHEQDRAETVVDEISAGGGEAVALFLDLNNPESICASLEAIVTRWGRIDILVNNAIQWGRRRISQAPAFEDLPPDEWREVLRGNIEGVYLTVQSAVHSMRRSGWGRIVNVSSVAAEDGLRGATWYSMVKASLHGLTRTLAKELGPDGILVNCVMPGLTATDRIADVSPLVRQRVEETSPIRRVLTPPDVAKAVVFLCSEANSAITGEIIRLGGRY
jgi:3-oxoacyl-[acyl-carrier protein] reductase